MAVTERGRRPDDDTHLHWVADIGGVHRERDAEISEQLPDERVAWTSVDGARNEARGTESGAWRGDVDRPPTA